MIGVNGIKLISTSPSSPRRALFVLFDPISLSFFLLSYTSLVLTKLKAQYVKIKDVNEYLNQYSNIRMGIRIIFEYSMVNDIFFATVTRKSRKLMTSPFIIQMAATRFSELSKGFSLLFEEKILEIGSITEIVDNSDSI